MTPITERQSIQRVHQDRIRGYFNSIRVIFIVGLSSASHRCGKFTFDKAIEYLVVYLTNLLPTT